jgi:hypothetical protein
MRGGSNRLLAFDRLQPAESWEGALTYRTFTQVRARDAWTTSNLRDEPLHLRRDNDFAYWSVNSY